MREFDFDRHLDLELEKYNNECMMRELVSSCCGISIEDDSNICPECKNICNIIEFGEYKYEKYLCYQEMKFEEMRDDKILSTMQEE